MKGSKKQSCIKEARTKREAQTRRARYLRAGEEGGRRCIDTGRREAYAQGGRTTRNEEGCGCEGRSLRSARHRLLPGRRTGGRRRRRCEVERTGCRRACSCTLSLCDVVAHGRLRAVLVAEAETAPLALDLGAGQARHLLGHLDVPHLLNVATRKDDVDLCARGRRGRERWRRVNDGLDLDERGSCDTLAIGERGRKVTHPRGSGRPSRCSRSG